MRDGAHEHRPGLRPHADLHVNHSGPRLVTGPRWLTRSTSLQSDDYFVTDFVAWNVAFDRLAVTHAPLFNSTLMVVVVV